MTKLCGNIINLIQNSDKHMTAEEIFMLCKENDVKVSFASIYRILTQLVNEGKLRRVLIPGEADRFDKTVYPHDHALCSECGRVYDIDTGDLGKRIAEMVGDSFRGYSLSVKYICPNCRMG